MLNIKEQRSFYRKLKSGLLRLVNRIENNNNPDIRTNGESDFLESFFKTYKGKKVTVLDIGANIGEYSEILISLFEKHNVDYHLFLFEPVSSTFQILKNKFSANPKIVLNNFGLSEKDGEHEIYFDQEKSTLASLYKRDLSELNISLNKKETIQVRRLDNFLIEHSIKKIDFIKIDIEGHEVSAFKGFGEFLNARNIDALQFEYGGANIDSRTFLKDIYQLLESRGFGIYKVKRNFLEKREYQVNMENFFHANYIALASRS